MVDWDLRTNNTPISDPFSDCEIASPDNVSEATEALSCLLPHEKEILVRIAAGDRQVQIAKDMRRTQGSISHTLSRIRFKLLWARDHGAPLAPTELREALTGVRLSLTPRGRGVYAKVLDPDTLTQFMLEWWAGATQAELGRKHGRDQGWCRHLLNQVLQHLHKQGYNRVSDFQARFDCGSRLPRFGMGQQSPRHLKNLKIARRARGQWMKLKLLHNKHKNHPISDI
jgi:hypothetical protein